MGFNGVDELLNYPPSKFLLCEIRKGLIVCQLRQGIQFTEVKTDSLAQQLIHNS